MIAMMVMTKKFETYSIILLDGLVETVLPKTFSFHFSLFKSTTPKLFFQYFRIKYRYHRLICLMRQIINVLSFHKFEGEIELLMNS